MVFSLHMARLSEFMFLPTTVVPTPNTFHDFEDSPPYVRFFSNVFFLGDYCGRLFVYF